MHHREHSLRCRFSLAGHKPLSKSTSISRGLQLSFSVGLLSELHISEVKLTAVTFPLTADEVMIKCCTFWTALHQKKT